MLDRATDKATRLVANEEGFREKAYRNAPTEPWTIGFGFTYWPDGRSVKPDDRMPRAEAESFLSKQIIKRLAQIRAVIKPGIYERLNSNQLAALVSLHFNLGPTQFNGSTFLKRINVGDFKGAGDAFLLWKRGNTADDLLPRRKRERALWNQPEGKDV